MKDRHLMYKVYCVNQLACWRKTFIALFLFSISCHTHAQDSIQHRLILIGDAGEITNSQQRIMEHAARNTIHDKTTVLLLGDNVYPRGTGLAASSEEQLTHTILDSQFKPFRSAGVAVYFITGNHDWDRSGPMGYAKVIALNTYINAQADSSLKVAPGMACRDPYEITISDNLVIIAVDTEWWLNPYRFTEVNKACTCNTQTDVIQSLENLRNKNIHKTIILATHHPLQSYGTHGGYFSWQDHIFPLRVIKKNLYIPMPVIGSLYPLMRKAFPNHEDLHHPRYKTLIRDLNSVFISHPNTVVVSGHEHVLQLIQRNIVQVVSGSGSRRDRIRTRTNGQFVSGKAGYVIADLLKNGALKFTYYSEHKHGLQPAYTYLRNSKE